MSDQTLLLVGCLVTFIACAGAYLGLREGFSYGSSTRRDRVARGSESAEGVDVKSGVVGAK